MDVKSWIALHKNAFLKKSDLKNWPVGEMRRMLVLDKDYEQYYIWDNITPLVPHQPLHYFQANVWFVTYKGDSSWTIGVPDTEIVSDKVQLPACENIETDIHLIINERWFNQEENGKYPELDKLDQLSCIVVGKSRDPPMSEIFTLDWENIPKDINIGWRGPMIPFESINATTEVYCN
jgi:hypothetical protein